ncbi:hypothetical protein CCR83_05575 [Rhodobacter veldkampii DSM 11550]|uniref:DUF5368 domain-containing protein n=1 Tax=Phaeovulum veldkampii DSM 11550 TaxID=1185920 RepID=A0A2T4JM02_9RHOB|nr:DUF5368 domain-containing protein [Phaeovulum veldkampii]MBK5945935.1 hypothetical protein [Phaeovulum veldkampii DSM 11550]NCU20357.1 hypothetical protein [Candidatus Falkowbacteria bacterium]PTE18941.1 hypothetical protein C5F46_01900 [Phaeovulum veldkampii DSM 11550]TDQ64670.1 hypothetical protein EV658_101133 [Phaeovulum veldkampii DSM 11550]
MKELTLETLIAVFEEIYGRGLFWTLVVLAGLITLGFAYVLIRDHQLSARRLVNAEIFAPLGAVGAVLFVLWFTNSKLGDIGGPIDWIIFAGIAIAGAGGLTIFMYTLQSILWPKKS